MACVWSGARWPFVQVEEYLHNYPAWVVEAAVWQWTLLADTRPRAPVEPRHSSSMSDTHGLVLSGRARRRGTARGYELTVQVARILGCCQEASPHSSEAWSMNAEPVPQPNGGKVTSRTPPQRAGSLNGEEIPAAFRYSPPNLQSPIVITDTLACAPERTPPSPKTPPLAPPTSSSARTWSLRALQSPEARHPKRWMRPGALLNC